MPSMAPPDPTVLTAAIPAYLHFCRIEKGLSTNTVDAYRADLDRFQTFASQKTVPSDDPTIVREYLNSLYKAEMNSRSIARHLTSLRGFFKYLLSENRITQDPTEHLQSPRQWQNVPRFLNRQQVDNLLEAPDPGKPTGLRDRAMLQVLYATTSRLRTDRFATGRHPPADLRSDGDRQRQ